MKRSTIVFATLLVSAACKGESQPEVAPPADTATAEAYDELYEGLMDDVGKRLAALAPPDADPGEVARTIVAVVDAPKGERPFRVTIDPADEGSEQVSDVADRIRADFYDRIGFTDLLATGTSAGA